MKKVLWLTFLMSFVFLFSFELNLSSAAVCCLYPSPPPSNCPPYEACGGECNLGKIFGGNTCPDSSLCAWYSVPDCNSNICGYVETCGSNTYYCVYQNGQWQWSTSKPQNFCCSDADCPAQNNVKGKCDTTGSVTGTPYTCYWPTCSSNSDCVDNTCCTADPNGPNPGGPGGSCVSQGIYSNNATWLCDPPEWNINQNILTNQPKTQNIFDLILSFFSHFFQR